MPISAVEENSQKKLDITSWGCSAGVEVRQDVEYPETQNKSPVQSEGILLEPMMASMILFQRVVLSTVKLLRGIHPFGETWFESGHLMVSTPTFRCVLFPVVELQMATGLDKIFCYAMLQIINCQVHYASVSVGFAAEGELQLLPCSGFEFLEPL